MAVPRQFGKVRRILVAIDFDSTLTLRDTTAVVPVAIAKHLADQGEHDASKEQSDRWHALVQAYSPPLPPDMEVLKTREQLQSYFELRSQHEVEAIDPIQSSLVFSGASKELLEDVAKTVETYPHASNCLSLLLSRPDLFAVNVISVNLCGQLLTNCLKNMISSEEYMDRLGVFCNFLSMDQNVSTGEIVGGIHTSFDKFKVFDQIKRDTTTKYSDLNASSDEVHTEGESISVYIGDSVTDLQCLLDATIGVVIGNNYELRDMIQSDSPIIQSVSLAEALESGLLNTLSNDDNKVPLLLTENWKEIMELFEILVGKSRISSTS